MITSQILWYWLHLIGVIVWAGGFFYLVVAFIPALNTQTASQDRSIIIQKVVARFRRVTWIAIVLLIVTGILNLIHRVSFAMATQQPVHELLPRGYMGMLGVKLLIVLSLIVHHATHLLDLRELDDGRVGLKSPVTLIVTSVLFLLAVLLGVTLLTL